MSKFKSINYSRVVCEDCGAVSEIEPGREFEGLNCTCDKEKHVFQVGDLSKEKLKELMESLDNNMGVIVPLYEGADTEISKPVQQELDYAKTQTVTVIGRFENGDYEVCNSNDLSDTWRVPKDTFESTYKVIEDETPTNSADNKQENALSEDNTTYSISLDDLKDLSIEDIKAKFNMDELRVLAKALNIRSASQMKEDKLVGKLLERIE